MSIAIETEASKNIKNSHLKGLWELVKDQQGLKQRIIPTEIFCQLLWSDAFVVG